MGSKELTFYCDIDDTIREYVLGMVRRYGWPKTFEAERLEQMFDINWGEHWRTGNHASFLMGLMPFEGAQEALWALATVYSICYVTATRPGGIEETVTRLWLKRHGFPRGQAWFFKTFDAKAKFLVEHAGYRDVVIDDLGSVLSPVYERTSAITIVMNAPWNRGVQAHWRVDSWSDVVKILRVRGS